MFVGGGSGGGGFSHFSRAALHPHTGQIHNARIYSGIEANRKKEEEEEDENAPVPARIAFPLTHSTAFGRDQMILLSVYELGKVQ